MRMVARTPPSALTPTTKAAFAPFPNQAGPGRGSITAAQIIAEAARRLNLDPPRDPTAYATATLAEAAQALGDGLRARGQARLATAGAAAQTEALADADSRTAAIAARTIGDAVEQILDEAAQLRA